MASLPWAPAICGMVSGAQSAVSPGSEPRRQSGHAGEGSAVWSWEAGPPAIDVCTESEGLAAPGSLQGCEQVVLRILSLGKE